MANRGFSRGQTQVLFRHLPEAIFEHDDYGLCKVTQVALGDAEVNRDALFDAMFPLLTPRTDLEAALNIKPVQQLGLF